MLCIVQRFPIARLGVGLHQSISRQLHTAALETDLVTVAKQVWLFVFVFIFSNTLTAPHSSNPL